MSGETQIRKRPIEGSDGRARKRFKISDLPVPAATRSAIDGLVLTTKKKGKFDWLRKEVWAKFADGEAKASFTRSLMNLAESEIERDPSLLSRDRGKAATLIEGAVDRTDIYRTVEAEIDALIEEKISHVENAIREIRENEIGKEAAARERACGSKTEEDYAREAEDRRKERQRVRDEELAKQKEKEEEEARVRAAVKAKEEEEQERERRKEMERAERHRLELEKEREARSQAERRWEEDRDKERPRYTEQETDRQAEHETDQADSKGPWGDESTSTWRHNLGRDERIPIKLAPEEDEELAEQALNLLLKESYELAAKARARPELERSESLEPPSRKGQRPKSLVRDMAGQKASEKNPKPEASIESSRAPVGRSSRDRSRSPSRHRQQRQHSHEHRSHDWSSRREDEYAGATGKGGWKPTLDTPRDRDADPYRRPSTREHRDRSRSRSPTKDYGNKRRLHRRDSTTSNAYVRGPSPYSPSIRRRRSPTPTRHHHDDYRHHRHHHYHRRSRSRSYPPPSSIPSLPPPSSSSRRRRQPSRSRSPAERDTYRPSGRRTRRRSSSESPPPPPPSSSSARKRDWERARDEDERYHRHHRRTDIDRYIPTAAGSGSGGGGGTPAGATTTTPTTTTTSTAGGGGAGPGAADEPDDHTGRTRTRRRNYHNNYSPSRSRSRERGRGRGRNERGKDYYW